MNIRLGTFACAGLETQLGSDITVGLQAALSHYAERLASGQAPAGFPLFRRETAYEPQGAEYEVSLEHQVEIALRREGLRQRANLEQLATHAVFVFLADMDRISDAA
jgi:hypothetical protein